MPWRPAARSWQWRPTPELSSVRLARVLNRIIDSYPFAGTIHLVMDNLNIHCRKILTDYFGEKEGGYLWNRLSVHHTPNTAVG